MFMLVFVLHKFYNHAIRSNNQPPNVFIDLMLEYLKQIITHDGNNKQQPASYLTEYFKCLSNLVY